MSGTATTHAIPTEIDVVTVEGPEAAAYLHGQLSQDVTGLAVGATTWTFVLAPDGKVDALGRLHRADDDRFLLLVDAGHGDAVSDRLNRFKLRMDCTVTSATTPAVSVRGPAAGEVGPAAGAIVVDAGWPGPGVDVLGRSEPPIDAVDGDAELLTGLRIAAGIPAMGLDVEEGSLAASSGMLDRAVDFSKGCFTGQELVARMDSRGGTAPTRLVRLRGDGAVPAAGSDVQADGDVVGTVRSVAHDPIGDGWLAFASVSRRLDPAADPSVSVDGHAAGVDELGDRR